MKFIQNTSDLENFCLHLSTEEFITVDLEFLREKTYYAELCLIQVASVHDAAIIDPMAKDIDLSAFFTLMADKNIVKVFHSCRQDIEILYTLSGFIPEPIFDSQIAAMVLGFGESVSYENLVAKLTGAKLDKTCRLSNWSKRPLTNAQLEYAISDVTHLTEIYQKLKHLLAETGRESWLEEENEELKDPANYVIEPNTAWQRLRHRSHSPAFLTLLRELAAWREERAKRKNLPRQMIIKDDSLLAIAAAAPNSLEEMQETRNIRQDISNGKLALEILKVIENFRNIPKNEYVKLEEQKEVAGGSQALLELVKMLLRIKSVELGVVPRLIAADEDLKAFCQFRDQNNPILKGWRYEVFGKHAEDLRGGNLSISFDKEKKQIKLTTI